MAREKEKDSSYKDDELEMNMTPMIDVTFQLLIFFILAGKFRVPEGRLDANLPKDGGPTQGKLDEVEDVRITLRMMGKLPPRDRKIHPRENPPDVLIEFGENVYRGPDELFKVNGRLAQLRQAQPDVGLVIVSEQTVEFFWVMKALNAASKAGYTKISFSGPIPTIGQ